MLFRLRPEDFRPEDRPETPAAASQPKPRMCDLSPEEWQVVHMMLSDHRRFGEVLASGEGAAAGQARRLAAAPRRGR